MTTVEIAGYLMVTLGGCLVLILLLCAALIWQEIASKIAKNKCNDFMNCNAPPNHPKPPAPPAPPPRAFPLIRIDTIELLSEYAMKGLYPIQALNEVQNQINNNPGKDWTKSEMNLALEKAALIYDQQKTARENASGKRTS